MYPNGDEKRNASDYISLYLVTAEDDILSITSEINVVFRFLVYDSIRDKYSVVQGNQITQKHVILNLAWKVLCLIVYVY